MPFTASRAVDAIRKRLDHPVIDGDGHLIEFTPTVRDFIAEEAGEELAKRFDMVVEGAALQRQIPYEKKREFGSSRTAWWALPTRNTLDRATAMLPDLMYARLDELGVDYALLYPTYGLVVTALGDDELRCAMARAFNRYYAEVWGGHRDRLEPVAAIPMFTPEEAIAELDHAVGERGLKAVMMAGVVPRPVPGAEGTRGAQWIDCLGHDSEYDYDPVWKRCVELGVTPTFHAGGQGWGTRMSRTNYVFNHIGNFAAAGEAACRSLLMGGAPMRFPELTFGFLEGGVAWGLNLYADFLGHFEKRNRHQIGHYDPENLDRDALARYFEEYAPAAVRERMGALDQGLVMLSDPGEDRATSDEFAESGIEDAAEVKRIFEKQFFFGCEADDPMNALAFDSKVAPHGARLRAIFASDISHWDVPDIRGVLPEAWELVEDGHLGEPEFRAFVCDNVANMLEHTNPAFFDGTVVAGRTPGASSR